MTKEDYIAFWSSLVGILLAAKLIDAIDEKRLINKENKKTPQKFKNKNIRNVHRWQYSYC